MEKNMTSQTPASKEFVYSGDTTPNKWFLSEARDADLLIHECYLSLYSRLKGHPQVSTVRLIEAKEQSYRIDLKPAALIS
jgi:ribonuclease BN (tRNA processing enzyme)